MSTIGFIGLGVMGSAMAVNLQRAGHDVVGYNRTPAKTQPLVAAGGTAAGSIAAAAAAADVVCLTVPDSPDVIDVLTAPDGVFASARPGTLVIDFSTIRPDVAADLAGRAKAAGMRFLDAPVSGGEAGARNAALSIMVGGEADDFAAAKGVFDAVGKTVVHVGAAGSGQTVKAANQLIVAGNIALLAEALVFLQAYDVDMTAAVEVLGGGLAGSAVLEQQAEKMLSHSFEPGARIDLHHKDLGIVTTAAREADVVIPLGSAVAQLMAAARATGAGDLDHSALLRVIEDLNGRGPRAAG